MAGTQNQADLLPDYDTAFSNIFNGVHQRAFFHKLASIRPQYIENLTQKQAESLLRQGAMIRQAEEEAQVKAAEEGYDPFLAAEAALREQLGSAGFQAAKQAGAREEQFAALKVAGDLMQDPVIYNSVLSLKANEAAQYARQLQSQR